MKTKKILLLVGLAIMFRMATSQELNNTLLFMKEVPQRSKVNPAIQAKCNFYLGFPVISSIYLNITNNTKNVFTYKELSELDKYEFKPEDFLNNLNNINHITVQSQLDWISMGYKHKENYFSFNVTEKGNAHTTFNKKLIKYLVNGVDSINVKNENLGPINADMMYYREFGLGMSKKINDNMTTIGVRAKILFGKANVNVEKFDAIFSANTTTDTGTVDINSKQKVNISLPIKSIETDEKGFVKKFDLDKERIKSKEFYGNSKNLGFAIDLGVSHNINDATLIHASLVDFGFINWKTNTYTLTYENDISWDADDWASLVDSSTVLSGDLNDIYENVLDSLQGEFAIDSMNPTYKTWLPAKLYFGIEHTLLSNDKLTLGGLCRLEFYQKNIAPAITLAANYKIFPFLDVTGSYTYHNRNSNLGLGISAQASIVQFYIATDDFLTPLLNNKIRNANIRFGLNLHFCQRNKLSRKDCHPYRKPKLTKKKKKSIKSKW